MKRIPLSLTIAIVGSLSSHLYAQLGTADSFGVLGGSTVTNTGATVISGDVGVSPGSSITGFPPGTVVDGTIHSNDAVAAQAHADTVTAYTTLAAMAVDVNLTGQDLGGLTLTPGVYHFDSSAQLTGSLILNTLGNPNAVFVFQIGSTLTTASFSSVTILGGGSDSNIYWQVGSSATLGTDTEFEGSILALTSITLDTGASITDGRALAINGAVTLDSNTITLPTPTTGSYWKGATNNLWSSANWSTDTTGSDNVNLMPTGANVVFSVTGTSAAHQNTVLDYDATIGSLTVNDSSPVSISGTNTLTIAGTSGTTGITVNSGAGVTSIAANVVLAGTSQTITVNNAAGLSMSGTIGGTIGLTKSGTGQLTLTAPETYTGPTQVNNGTLEVNGSITSNALVTGGALDGTGTVVGNVTAVGGVVRAGSASSPGGTLTVTGNYTQGSNAAYVATLISPNVSNLLAVSGQTQLGGTLFISHANVFPATSGEVFTIITSSSGVSGQFANVVDLNPTGTLLTLGAVYLPNSVLLEYMQGSFQSLSNLTPNESAVAAALDRLASDHPNSRLISALDNEKLSRLPGIYDEISPVDIAAIFDVGFAAAQTEAGNIERRLEDVRDNTFSDTHGAYDLDAKDGKHLIDKNGKDIANETFDRRWGFYASGMGEWVDIGNTWNATGSDLATGGGNIGMDYRLCDHLVIGITTGYSNTKADGFGDGRIDVDSGNANAYATWFSNGFFVNGMAGGSYSSYNTKRQSYGGNAFGNSEGTGYTGLIGTGYEYHACGWTMGPIASAQYTTVELDSFTEHRSLAPLHVSNQSENSLQSRVGARASYAWAVCHMTVTPELRAQWQHEYQDTAHGIGSSFAEDSATAFTVWGPQTGRDSLLLDAGTSVRLSERTTLFAYYTLNAFATNYNAQAVNAGVRFAF